MSFSSEVKEELSKLENLKNKENVKQELIGYLLIEDEVRKEAKDMLKYFIELLGKTENKPFECVGTIEEVNYVVNNLVDKNLVTNQLVLTINYDILNNAKSEAAAKLVDEERQLNNNIVTIKNFNGTKSEEQRLIDRLNVKYGQFFGKAKTLKEWYDKLTQSGKDYCDSLYNQILWEGKRQQALY